MKNKDKKLRKHKYLYQLSHEHIESSIIMLFTTTILLLFFKYDNVEFGIYFMLTIISYDLFLWFSSLIYEEFQIKKIESESD
jgi:hypothetical protein